MFHALTTVGTNASLDAQSSSEIFDAVSQYQRWGYDSVITALFLTSQMSYLHNIFLKHLQFLFVFTLQSVLKPLL